jgi:hypothetical protein
MPTAPIYTWSNTRVDPYMDPDDALEFAVQLKASTVYPAGTVLGEISATPGTFAAYASGNADGSQVPKGILVQACTTDASGNITGADAPLGDTRKDTHVYFAGTFRTTDLVGLDANAVTAGGWRIINGTAANGTVRLG